MKNKNAISRELGLMAAESHEKQQKQKEQEMKAKKETRFLAIKTNVHGDTYITTARKESGHWLVGGEVVVKGEQVTILNLDKQTFNQLKGCFLIVKDSFSSSQVEAFELEYQKLNAERLERQEQHKKDFTARKLESLKSERARRVEVFNEINNALHKAADFLNDANGTDISTYNTACRAFIELEKRFLDEVSDEIRKIETS
jgi:hypothetical protein